MAQDSGLPSKFRQESEEFVFVGGATFRIETTTREDVDVGLTTMMSCLNTLLKARDDGKIRFAAGVTARIFETMAVFLMRAGHASQKSREKMFDHWLAHGPDILDALIEAVAGREERLLMPEDLATAFMGTPDGD